MRDPSMWWPARLARRIQLLVRWREVESAMDAEMRFHIECEIAERVKQGMTPDDARRSAMRDFGGLERCKEDGRDARGLRPLDDAARDVAYAGRVLRRNPGFAAAVILTFALGVGCTTSIFSLVRGILLRPLPYAQPGALVALWERNAARGSEHNVVSVEAFEAWRDRARSVTAIAAMVPAPRTMAGEPAERITVAQVSPSFFRVLGVQPSLGRDFTPDDEANGGAPVVILSDALWRTRFGADPGVIGRTLVLDGESNTIVGVMPAAFDPPRFGWMTEYSMWIPFGATAGNRSWGRFLHVIARRRDGVSVDAVRAELASIAAQLVRDGRMTSEWSATAVPLAEQITGDVRKPLLVLFAAVTLLFLMSAVNVASLLATFARRRERELDVRRAIGATTSRLLRQQVTQSAVLGLAGTAAGIGIAFAATRGLVAVMPADVPRLADVHVDRAVLGAATLAAVATMLAVGVVTARRALRSSAQGSGARATARLGGGRIVVAEIAIGLVLSAFAVLMTRSVINLRSVDLGFQSASVVTGRVSLPSARYQTTASQRAFFDALVARARALPGVEAATVATTRPFACCAPSTIAYDATAGQAGERDAPTTDVRFVGDSYFTTLRVRVLAGGVFSLNESETGPPRAVISRSLARALWGDANPIGRRVSMKLFGTTTAEVIGVVGDVHLADARTPTRPALFLSAARFPSSERDIIVRGEGDAMQLLSSVRDAVAAQDKSVPLYRATTLAASLNQTMAQDRFTALLLAGFALLALALASVGVYGVLAGDVTRRRKEIGIRLALGARPSTVVRLVLGRTIPFALTGVAIGLVAALLLARSLSALVFGIATTDVVSFAAVAVVLLAVSVVATLGPAIRATRVSVLDVIRAE